MNISIEYVNPDREWSRSLDALSYTVGEEQRFQVQTAVFGEAYIAAGSEQTDIPLTLEEFGQGSVQTVQGAISEARRAPHLIVNTDSETAPRAVLDPTEFAEIYDESIAPIPKRNTTKIIGRALGRRVRSRLEEPEVIMRLALCTSALIVGAIVENTDEQVKRELSEVPRELTYAACKFTLESVMDLPDGTCINPSLANASGARQFEATLAKYEPVHRSRYPF